jgi:multicomponent Na+:H+ antiporter subunit E
VSWSAEVDGLKKKVYFFISLFLLWVVFTWVPNLSDLAIGAVACLIMVYFFGDFMEEDFVKIFRPGRLFGFILYLGKFIYCFVLGGVCAAVRILSYDGGREEGIVKLKTKLKSHASRTLLANAITVCPDTLTVDIIEHDVYVHFIGHNANDAGKALSSFEGLAGRVYD